MLYIYNSIRDFGSSVVRPLAAGAKGPRFNSAFIQHFQRFVSDLSMCSLQLADNVRRRAPPHRRPSTDKEMLDEYERRLKLNLVVNSWATRGIVPGIEVRDP